MHQPRPALAPQLKPVTAIDRPRRLLGEYIGARTLCKDCGREALAGPGQKLVIFCSTVCYENYPRGACKQMIMGDLVAIVAQRRSPDEVSGIRTRAALEQEALAILRAEPGDFLDVNPEGYTACLVGTRAWASKQPYPKDRIEPEGPEPAPMALGAWRAYVLAKGGGTPTRGKHAMPLELSQKLARNALRELPPQALGDFAKHLGTGSVAEATVRALGVPEAAKAYALCWPEAATRVLPRGERPVPEGPPAAQAAISSKTARKEKS